MYCQPEINKDESIDQYPIAFTPEDRVSLLCSDWRAIIPSSPLHVKERLSGMFWAQWRRPLTLLTNPHGYKLWLWQVKEKLNWGSEEQVCPTISEISESPQENNCWILYLWSRSENSSDGIISWSTVDTTCVKQYEIQICTYQKYQSYKCTKMNTITNMLVCAQWLSLYQHGGLKRKGKKMMMRMMTALIWIQLSSPHRWMKLLRNVGLMWMCSVSAGPDFSVRSLPHCGIIMITSWWARTERMKSTSVAHTCTSRVPETCANVHILPDAKCYLSRNWKRAEGR